MPARPCRQDTSSHDHQQPLRTGREPDPVGRRRFHSVCHRASSLARAHGAVDHDPALERPAFSALSAGAGSAPSAGPGCADPRHLPATRLGHGHAVLDQSSAPAGSSVAAVVLAFLPRSTCGPTSPTTASRACISSASMPAICRRSGVHACSIVCLTGRRP